MRTVVIKRAFGMNDATGQTVEYREGQTIETEDPTLLALAEQGVSVEFKTPPARTAATRARPTPGGDD